MVNSLILVCLIVTVYGIQAVPTNDEMRLANHLLKQYKEVGLRGRPVEKSGQAWNVSFSVSLNSIQEVNYFTQTMEVLVWYSLRWKDYYLKWNESDFNVRSIGLRPADIIMPDITLYNAASDTQLLNPYEQVVVSSSGHVYYVPQIKQKALCSMTRSKNVTCTLKYGSWIYSGDKLNLTLAREEVDMSFYQENVRWEVTATSATRNVKVYDCCPEAYIDLTFDITLKKKPWRRN